MGPRKWQAEKYAGTKILKQDGQVYAKDIILSLVLNS